MKIILNSNIKNMFDTFLDTSRNNNDNIEFINAISEKHLFDLINVGDVDVFILDSTYNFTQKAINILKKKHQHIIIITILNSKDDKINNSDIYVPYLNDLSFLYSAIINNAISFISNFNLLKKLSVKLKTKIDFCDCSYDPNLRTLYHNNVFITNLTDKSGSILEILASNYGKLVKKEFILEKVWLKSDYFSNRTMDVYVTGLRKMFKDNNINLTIKNVSKVGLILE